MNISLESPELHAIQAYDNQQIQINSVLYSASLIVSSKEIITDLEVKTINEISKETISLFLEHSPDLIIIGHERIDQTLDIEFKSILFQKHIGVEVMSIGAACRTYNVLINEDRNVVLMVIFN